jgi:hypothetical protein
VDEDGAEDRSLSFEVVRQRARRDRNSGVGHGMKRGTREEEESSRLAAVAAGLRAPQIRAAARRNCVIRPTSVAAGRNSYCSDASACLTRA